MTFPKYYMDYGNYKLSHINFNKVPCQHFYGCSTNLAAKGSLGPNTKNLGRDKVTTYTDAGTYNLHDYDVLPAGDTKEQHNKTFDSIHHGGTGGIISETKLTPPWGNRPRPLHRIKSKTNTNYHRRGNFQRNCGITNGKRSRWGRLSRYKKNNDNKQSMHDNNNKDLMTWLGTKKPRHEYSDYETQVKVKEMMETVKATKEAAEACQVHVNEMYLGNANVFTDLERRVGEEKLSLPTASRTKRLTALIRCKQVHNDVERLMFCSVKAITQIILDLEAVTTALTGVEQGSMFYSPVSGSQRDTMHEIRMRYAMGANMLYYNNASHDDDSNGNKESGTASDEPSYYGVQYPTTMHDDDDAYKHASASSKAYNTPHQPNHQLYGNNESTVVKDSPRLSRLFLSSDGKQEREV